MIDPLSEPTRLVVVASGFGLWRQGRHEISARWGDVVRIASVASPAGSALDVTLADGRVLRIDGTLAGWDAFLSLAPAALLGAAAPPRWFLPAALDGPAAVLYERRAPRQRSLQ